MDRTVVITTVLLFFCGLSFLPYSVGATNAPNNTGYGRQQQSFSATELKSDDAAPGGVSLSDTEKTTVEFLCKVQPRSSPVPTTVHKLRPSDISVIGAMGDSITAGSGIKATNVVEELNQNRGLSWSGGGEGTFEEHLTMPNIVKKYNSHLYGYATGDGNEKSRHAHFNVAVIGSTSSDMAGQAMELVDRMKNDPKVDFVNDWKMITILSGNNDLCDSCNKPDVYNEVQFYENLIQGLDVLHSELPRTLVNLVEPVNMEMMAELNKGLVCKALHVFLCDCAAFPKTRKAAMELQRLTQQFQKTVREIALSGRYDTRLDFTVVHQPLFSSPNLPRKEDSQPDMSYFAPDCFHLSRKGQAAAALALWNNMVTPIQDKQLGWLRNDSIKCSSEDEPYIYTNRNSNPPSPASEPATGGGFPHFTSQMMVASAVCGVVAVAIGAAVIVAGVRRIRVRQLYVQIQP